MIPPVAAGKYTLVSRRGSDVRIRTVDPALLILDSFVFLLRMIISKNPVKSLNVIYAILNGVNTSYQLVSALPVSASAM